MTGTWHWPWSFWKGKKQRHKLSLGPSRPIPETGRPMTGPPPDQATDEPRRTSGAPGVHLRPDRDLLQRIQAVFPGEPAEPPDAGAEPGSYRDYLALLQGTQGQEELKQLFNEITTNETSFWRNPPQIEAFQRIVLPMRPAWPGPGAAAGCASGPRPAPPGRSRTPWP